MNNIAIIILAHHNPKQLTILINHLKTDFDLYIQIDKKSNLEISELPKANKKYDNYIYISGDDFPIKSNIFIKDFFKENKDNIYTYANPLPIATWGFNKGFDRLDRYWYMKINSRKFAKIFARATLLLQRMLFIKNKRFPIKYFAGSNWVNLTHKSVEYIFDFLDKNPSYFKKLKYSRATDEIWIQSILMNSNLKDKVVNYDLRYIDWNKGPDHPRTLDITDYDSISNSDALFARKININKNGKEIVTKLLKDIS